ncbi:SMODS domain-containing nucleotidyltransferase [Janibacter sp. G1551]|uniref:SMODS domain-containing nucleotidyltransferase n=1 Tax=Janibacter sp. G1551 TaxID=3420440 RepID=UPI003D019D49
MASSTASAWLADLTSLFTPSTSQFDGAKGHKASIESRLDYVLGVYRMFEIGSLRHGTGVWRYSDADYLVSLKGIQPASPLTMLTKVKDALQARFTSTTITIRQPAVVCHFSDGIVEVVPGYIASGGGYMIADPRGGWMRSFPEEHNKYVNEINAKHSGGGAKRLARHLKIWKYQRKVPVSSCYLEMRAAKFLSETTAYVPIVHLHYAFKHLQSIELASMNDPTGLGSRFGSCSSDSTKSDALSKLDTAVLRSGRALTHHLAGDHDKAIEQLKLLFNR